MSIILTEKLKLWNQWHVQNKKNRLCSKFPWSINTNNEFLRVFFHHAFTYVNRGPLKVQYSCKYLWQCYILWPQKKICFILEFPFRILHITFVNKNHLSIVLIHVQWLFSFATANSTWKAFCSGTSGSAVCISVCLPPLTPRTFKSWEKWFQHLAKILWKSATKSPFSS